MQGQLVEAQRHLSRAREWCSSKAGVGKLEAHRMIVEEARIASHCGRFQHAASSLAGSREPSPVNESLVLYASALNALFAGSQGNALADSRTGFERVREVCTRRGEVHLRALGEIAVLEGSVGMCQWFEVCVGLCGMTGVPPLLLYRCHVLRELEDRFRGWMEYLGTRWPVDLGSLYP
ncbi:hypothetical protein F5I97DRAFT_6952 [Phlebopus sp. FC_14]|nr:hypothetical protein F5I97DRAFT_6952 [Phlebopus sp. FC_14]